MPQPLRSNSRNCIYTLERTPSASKRTRTEPQLFQAHHVLVHLVDAIIRWAKWREKGKERRRRRRVTIMMAMLEFGCLIRGWLEYGTTLASSSFGCITPSLPPSCPFVCSFTLFFFLLSSLVFFFCACLPVPDATPPSLPRLLRPIAVSMAPADDSPLPWILAHGIHDLGIGHFAHLKVVDSGSSIE